jgi:predicted nucleic acid-binding protein
VTTYLVDSSIWIEHIRGGAPRVSSALTTVLESTTGDRLAICEPIAMELLGADDARQSRAVQALVDGLPSLDVQANLDFRSAARLFSDARRSGRTVRSLLDCVIAAVAIRHDAVIVHRDRDYEAIASVSPLRAERWN